MFDDESELTDLSDFEDEKDVPLASLHPPPIPVKALPKQSAMKETKTTQAFYGPRLTEPHIGTASVESIYNEVKSGTIDLDPEYQRGVVWHKTKQGALIDSIMHNFVIFPLIFAERTRADGVKTKICIDGKQRISAIQLFMTGKISYVDSQRNRSLWYEKVPPGAKGTSFTPAQRQQFNQTMLSAYRYLTIDEHDEREVFQRVQLGVALQPCERLPAINGPHCDLVREMRTRLSLALRDHLGWTQSKGRDFFILGQIGLLVRSCIAKPNTTSVDINLSKVEAFLRLSGSPTDALHIAVLDIIDVFNYIYEHSQLNNAVLDIHHLWFVMAGFLIYRYRSQYSIGQLADAINQMRAKVKYTKTTKVTSKTRQSLFTFIAKEVPNLTLTDQASGAKLPAPPTLPNLSSAPVPPLPTASASRRGTKRTAPKAPAKRKRAESQQPSDDKHDDLAGPVAQKRAKAAKLPAYSDDDDCVIKASPPTKLRTPRRPISVAIEAKASSSKAATKVRRPPSKTATTSVSAGGSIHTQVGKPSVKPTRTKNPTTACAVPSPAAPSESISLRTPLTAEATMLTPPSSTVNAFITPVNAVASVLASLPSPIPPPTSRHASQLFDDNLSPLTEEHKSPILPSHTPPPPSGRLARLRAAKEQINSSKPLSAYSLPQVSSLLRQDPILPSPKDPEAELHAGLDYISSTISSPAGRVPRPPSISSNQIRPTPPPVASTSASMIVDGTTDRNVLNDVKPIQRQKPTQSQDIPTPVPPIDTGSEVNQFRSTSALGRLSNQSPLTPQSSSVSPTAAHLLPKKTSYKGMPPIPKLTSKPSAPSHALPTVTRRDKELSGGRSLTPRSSQEGNDVRHHRPYESLFDSSHRRSRRD